MCSSGMASWTTKHWIFSLKCEWSNLMILRSPSSAEMWNNERRLSRGSPLMMASTDVGLKRSRRNAR